MGTHDPAPATALGVDVGGANLKWGLAAAPRRGGRGPAPREEAGGAGVRAGDNGVRAGGAGSGRAVVVASGTISFPLWREPDALPSRLGEVRRRARRAAVDALAATEAGRRRPHVTALTLTAELADCFRDRAEGVRSVVAAARRVWGAERLRVLCSDGALRSPEETEASPREAAAANWRAPATWLARGGHEVLLADMGSTTTDLVPVSGGRAGSGARTDLERLRAGELVYSGLLRTPVCAMVREVELPGGTVPLAAERFAVAADVHLWLGSLSADEYRCETPDGAPATRAAAGRRLARMVCAEPRELGDEGIGAVARAAADAQARDVADAIGRQRRGPGRLPRAGLPTGAGADLAAALLRRAGLELADPPPPLAGEHAPASTATTLALLALATDA